MNKYDGWTMWPEMADKIRKGARYQWGKQEVTCTMSRDACGCKTDIVSKTRGARELRFECEQEMLYHAIDLLAPLPQWVQVDEVQP